MASVASAAAGALTLAAGLTAKKPTAEATGSQTSFSANPDAGAPLALGRTGTAGDIVARFGWDTRDAGDNDRQAFVAVLSLGPIAAVEGQTVDRVPVAYTGTGGAIGAYAGFMWSMTQIGALASAALGFGAGAGAPPGWTAQHALSGKAAATWTLRFDTKAKQFQNGVPAPMWTVRGTLAYDPRRDSTYPGGDGPHRMANPADTAAYDAAMATWEWTEDPYLLGLKWAHGVWQRDVRDPNSTYQRVMGIGAPWAAIDVAAFVEGANVAKANGWTCGGMVYSGDGKWDSMKKILQAGMGEPLALGARISCFVNAPKVSLATVTIDDVVGPASVSATQPRRDRINTITPRFRLEANNWQHLPGAPISVAKHVAEDRGKRSRAVDYWLIQNSKQVGTAVRYDIENSREFGPITLPVKLHWMGYKPGDCVTAQLPELGLNNQPILLLNRTLGAASGIVTLSARSETNAKHAFALGQTATPPTTPGVSGPPLVPVPAQDAWAITATSLISQAQTVPALIVTGSVDASTADAVVIEYRPFVSGQSIDAGWTSAGVWSVGASRAEITSVRSGTAYEVAISYQRHGVTGGRRIIGPVVTAGPTIDYDGVTGPNRPENGATVGAPPGTKVGDRPVEEVIAQLDQIEPITTDLSAIKEIQTGHSTELAVLDDARIDMQAVQRQMARDAGRLSEATLRLLAEADRTRTVLRDAGIVVDPVTGVVRIYAVDQLAEKTSKVELTLDAQKALIESKASTNYVNEQIALAVLDPAQAAQLEPIIARLASAEQSIDGLNAAVRQKADLIELTRVGGRVSTVEQDLDAVTGLVATKASQTLVDQLGATLTQVEQQLGAIGDTVGLSVSVRQARIVADQAAEGALRALLAGDDANQRQIAQVAQARQELTTRMDAGLLTEATYRLALAVEVAAVRALTIAETTARITGDETAARSIAALGVTTDAQSAAIGRLDQALINAAGGIAGTQTTIRQIARRDATADEASLRALIAGDQADQRRQAQLVQIQTELTTTMVANEAASAVARQALLARMGRAEGAALDLTKVVAENNQSTTTRLQALDAQFAAQAADIVATVARIAREEKARADAISAEAEARRVLSAQVNDPSTGLPWATGAIADLARVTNDRDNTNAALIQQVRAMLDGIGNVGIQQAFEAVINRLGKIEGQYSVAIDVNGNWSGFQVIGGATGPGSFNLINTDLRLGTGRVIWNNGQFMEVKGIGFGRNSDLLSWYGPTMAIADCTRANGLEWKGTDGVIFTAAAIKAGPFTNQGSSTLIASDASFQLGPFTSDGKSKTVVASYTFRRIRRVSPGGGGAVTGTPSATLALEYQTATGAWSQVGTIQTGQPIIIVNPATDQDPGRLEEAMSGSVTWTDTRTMLEGYLYRLRLTQRTQASFTGTASGPDSITQSLSIISQE
ncbi:hypothetical protein [Sphingomonas sanguinis]|uniref:hypothetical protein n=1 Tax=Sphingomonas sanguinis TaxID=33051 RepID=UPI00187C84F9|nr:hypothetical protein [Sphingomonas sanguinis]